MDAQRLLKETRDRLRQLEGRYAEFSRASGISYSSLTKLAQGHENNPTVASLQRLINALDAFEAAQTPPAPQVPPPTTGAAR